MSRAAFLQLGHRGLNGEVFGLSPKDCRQHVYVLGKTGSGKSTLLRNLFLQHVYLDHGACFIDPHGDLAEELLSLIPRQRINDVIYFNPADTNFPIGFNVLAGIEKERREAYADDLTMAFRAIWDDSWGPRLHYYLKNALNSLLHCPETSLLDVNRLFHDAGFRKRVVARCNPGLREFWLLEFARHERERRIGDFIAPIENKIGQLTTNSLMRNIFGQGKNAIRFRKLMDRRKLLIANLSKGTIGEGNSRLFGSLLMTLIKQAAFSRANIPERYRSDFFLLADEFHLYTGLAFADILSGARKYRLSVTLAHQYTQQIQGRGVLDAVLGNVGALLVFRVGSEDAELMAREFEDEWPAHQFVELDRFKVMVKLQLDGQSSMPFWGVTLPPFGERVRGTKQKIINHTRQFYATPRAKVEHRINRSLTSLEYV